MYSTCEGVRRSLLIVLIFCCALPAVAGKIIYVPADQPTIQAGIDAATNGDTVLVSPGTYKENISFNGKSIIVASASGPAVTIIDGQQQNTVVTFTGGETRKAVLRGFTIQNGNGFNNFQAGGVNISSASPIVAGNVLISNTTCNGGSAIGSSFGGPSIRSNIITGNSNGYCGGYAVYLSGDNGDEIVGNIISSNLNGGLIISDPFVSTTVEGNTISSNNGVGINFDNGNQTTANIVENVITENQGVGVSWFFSPITLVNNTISSNFKGGCCTYATEVFGQFVDSQVTMQNNLLFGSETSPAFACNEYDSDPVLENNDIFAAESASYGGACPDRTGVDGNISTDPFFVAPFSGNYHLQSTSPAIDVGSNSASSLPKKDFDGDPRILGKIIDIGADEYSPKTMLTLSAYHLQYEGTQVGQTSAPQTTTLTNHGTTSVVLNLIATGSEFSQTNNCGNSLAPGASCQINVSFAPIGGGQRESVLGVFTGATLNPQTVSLRGAGLAPSVRLDTMYIDFNIQVIGTTGQQLDNLTNAGQAPLAITSFQLSGSSDFSQTNNCPISPSTLAPGASCTITFSYTPTIIGYEQATLNIYDNALPSPQHVNIQGNGVSAGYPTLNPDSLTFPDTLIGSRSGPQYSTLTNTGTGVMGNISIQSYGDFPASSDCPSSLAPGAYCTITVSFSPTQLGSDNSTVYVYNDSAYTGFLSVSGKGLAPVPTITSLSPDNLPATSPDTQITINGTGFVWGAQVSWNGTLFSPYVSDSTQLSVTIPAAYLTNPGTVEVAVINPPPGGGTSNLATFTIYTAYGYAVKSVPYRYEKVTGTNLNLYFYSAAWITSPFPVQFGGGSFTNLEVDAGGNLSFIASGGEYNGPIPDPYLNTIIAPFWAPLYSFGAGNDNNVFWAVTGEAPDRHLVIEWRDVSLCCDTSGLYTVRFQVIFEENNPEVLFNYADTEFGGGYSYADNGATATVGIQVTPDLATQYSYDTPSLSSHSSLLWYPSSPIVTLSTSTLDFGYHLIGTRSTVQKVTLTNGGLVPLEISSITIDNPDFAQDNNCGSMVQPGHSCTIRVAFTPSQPTLELGTLTISDNGWGGVQSVSLSGIGATTQVVIFPSYLNFGNVAVGKDSTLPITLANAANQKMTIQQIVTAPSVYTQTNDCGNAVDPGAHCTINVTFTPTKKGTVNGGLGLGINGKPTKAVARFVGTGN